MMDFGTAPEQQTLLAPLTDQNGSLAAVTPQEPPPDSSMALPPGLSTPPPPLSQPPLQGPPPGVDNGQTPAQPQQPQGTPTNPLKAALDQILKDSQANQKQREDLLKILKQEQDPDSIYRYLPNGGKPKPSDQLRDMLYNQAQLNLRNPIYGSLKGEPYTPIEEQRLKLAQTTQQQRLKTVMDQLQVTMAQDQSNKAQAANLQAQIHQGEQDQTAAARAATYQQMAQEKAKADTAMDNWREAKLAQDKGIAGAKAAVAAWGQELKKYGNPHMLIVDDMIRRGIDPLSPEGAKLQRDFVLSVNPEAFKGTSTTTAYDEEGNKTVTKTPTLPGGRLASLPTGSAPPVPGSPPAAGTPGGPPVLRPKPLPRPFDPDGNVIDSLVRNIAQDGANWKAVPSYQKAAVNKRLMESNLQPNNVTNDIRGRAAMANQTISHLDTIIEKIKQADKDGDLGVLATRWNDLLTGDVGNDVTKGKLFSSLGADLSFLTKNMAMVHGGVRAAASKPILEEMKKTLQAKDPATMISQLQAARGWMVGYSKMAGPEKPIGQQVLQQELLKQYGLDKQ